MMVRRAIRVRSAVRRRAAGLARQRPERFRQLLRVARALDFTLSTMSRWARETPELP